MQRAIRLDVLAVVIGIAALLAGCGRTIGPGGSQQMGASPPATTGVSSSATAGTSSQATPGTSGQRTGGQVTLTLDKQRYATGDTIAVTIHNGLPQTIWATDHKTTCTVVTAERLQNGQWGAVGGCRLMTPTSMMPMPAASATVQHLSSSGWSSGTYRVTLTYTGGDEGSGSPGGVAYSVEFTVG